MGLISREIMRETFNIDVTVNSISLDSRIKADIMFCIQGKHLDGHDFAKAALTNGFKYIVAEKDLDIPTSHLIRVDNVIKSLKKLTYNVRKKLNATVIAITGTAGKTSTKEQMRCAFAEKNTLASPSSYNTIYGLALTICNLEYDPQYLILEVGISHPGEMKELAEMIQPDYSIITSIGAGHIGNFRNIEHIAEEKSQLLQYTKKFAFFPEICTKYCPSSLKYQIITPQNNTYEQNMIPIIKIAEMENLTQVKQNMKNYSVLKGRNNIVQLTKNGENFTIIDGSYNSNPLSLEISMKQLMQYPNKKIAVLGEMRELGNYSAEYHRVDYDVDHLLLLGDIWASPNGKIFTHYEKLCKHLDQIIEKDVIILLKGSNSTDIKLIAEYLEENYGN